ncbi:MAG: alpha-L-rhamnosidase N-terminal domain-containing protein, partial [Paludibacter sp.]
MKLSGTFSILFFLSTSLLLNARSQAIPVNLSCDFWTIPQGIDVPNPELSWTIQTQSDIRAMHQSAYQVLVASSFENLKKDDGDLWNSGKVQSDHMGQITYSGKALQSSRQCWWKVKIWDEKGIQSVWSEPSQWTMGVLNPNEWKAQWITAAGAEKYAHQYKTAKEDFNQQRNLAEFRRFGPKPEDLNYSSMLLRKTFISRPKIKRAVVHVCGLGQYELFINGSKIGDYILAPGWSYYPKTVLYDTYDVTQQIKTGNNAIGLILGNSMYNIQPDSIRYVKFLNSYGPLKAIVQMRLEYEDGTIQILGSDKSWQVMPGPVTYSNLYGGEDFDARLVPQGWNQSSFNSDE